MTSLRLSPADQAAYAEQLSSADARTLELARDLQRLAFEGERDYSAADFVPAPLYLRMARNLGPRHRSLMDGVVLAVTGVDLEVAPTRPLADPTEVARELGWWNSYLGARMTAIRSMLRLGRSVAEVGRDLGLADEVQLGLLVARATELNEREDALFASGQPDARDEG